MGSADALLSTSGSACHIAATHWLFIHCLWLDPVAYDVGEHTIHQQIYGFW
jgi:hypothetical protein